MDKERFDSLARAMATGKSRRDVLKLIAGGAAGGALAITALDDASAECHNIACSSADQCCAGAPECVNGVCVESMAAAAPAAEEPAAETATGGATTAVTTVPATGIGPAGADSGMWVGAAVAGGAALLASRILRREKQGAEDSA